MGLRGTKLFETTIMGSPQVETKCDENFGDWCWWLLWRESMRKTS